MKKLKQLKKETKDLEAELARVLAQRKFLNNLKKFMEDIDNGKRDEV